MSSRLIALLALVLALPAGMPLAAQDLGEAERLYQTGQYNQAETIARGIADAEPENAKANYLLGVALLEQNKVDEAEPRLKKAAELNFTPDQAKTALARVHLQRQQHDQALALLNEAHAVNAENADVYLYRGIAQASRSQFHEAVQDLDKAVQMKPNEPKAHYYAGLAYNGVKRPDKMVEHFQMFLKLAPDAPEAARVRSLLRNVR